MIPLSGAFHVLLVDRDTHAAMAVETMLHAAGCSQVVIAPDGGRAHVCARPDLMLYALQGAEVSSQLAQARELQKRWLVPVVFLVDEETCRELASTDVVPLSGCVIRPVSEQALKLAVDAALRLHQAETRLRRSEVRLQEVQRLQSIGIVAGGIAHEFNNLLTGIYGAVAVARGELPAGSVVNQRLDTIEAAAMRAADLCQRLSLPAGDPSTARLSICLNELVEESIAVQRAELKRGIQVQTGLAEKLPPVRASEVQLRQLVLNLLANAIEAIGDKSGAIRVLTYARRVSEPVLFRECELKTGEYVILEVADTGCGMDTITQGRIFDPLFSTKNPNRGMGLATVLRIVRRHMGAVTVESSPGQGACFRVFIPAVPAATVQNGEHPAQVTVSQGTDTLRAPGKTPNATVMVVDDDEAVRMMAKWIIEKAGLTAVTARDGDEALRLFIEEPKRYDLLLIDLTMPRMGGLETMERVRALRPDQRVVIVSGHNESALLDEIKLGDVGFMQKPFNPEGLRMVLHKCFSMNNN